LNGVDPLGRGRRIEKLAITPAPLSARITIASMSFDQLIALLF